MRAVVQRVTSASVTVDGELVSRIGPGLLCLIGVRDGDTDADAEFIARKLLNCRLWPSEKKAWDLSVTAQGYELLCVSQFTLHGRLSGNKPDFSKAKGPAAARDFYGAFVERLRSTYRPEAVKDGVFGAMMSVELVCFVEDRRRKGKGRVMMVDLPPFTLSQLKPLCRLMTAL
jgi:D-tyrosyl-tRNA(Tyr) deacylase